MADHHDRGPIPQPTWETALAKYPALGYSSVRARAAAKAGRGRYAYVWQAIKQDILSLPLTSDEYEVVTARLVEMLEGSA